MNELNNKSLEERIKEAELEKTRAETAEVQKRLKQIRILGVPLVQVIFGGIVVGFILLSYIRPIVTLDTDIASKKSEYDRIKGWIEQVRLDSINTALILGQKSLIRDRKRLDSVNIVLNKKINEIDLLQIEKVKYRREVDSLKHKRDKARIELRSLDEYSDYEVLFGEMFPQVKQSIRIGEVPVEGLPGITLKYILIPLRYAEVFIINKQNSDLYEQQKDKLNSVDSMQMEIMDRQMEIVVLHKQIEALKDTILSLRR